jgi:indole-3-glycerol phosphate synthase
MALERSEVAVIAEVKRRSPSKGWIKAGLGAVEQARAYHAGGAAAISILTEPNHFDGSTADLEIVGSEVHIPLLKKDFHVDAIQLLEARAAGASAVLLIARALPQGDLVRLMADADRLLLDALVEVRDRVELQRALDAGATIVGINNRNLETLEIDPRTSEVLLPLIPTGVIAIAESGVSSRQDVERVAAVGADAVLVGSALSAAGDPTEAVRGLAGVPRTRGQRGPNGH